MSLQQPPSKPASSPDGTHSNREHTWQVKANDRDFNNQFTKKGFLCFKRRKYADNVIKTRKYNVLTFLPFNLYEQFQRVANVYFLLMVILQGVPAISTLPWHTTMIPLLMVLATRGVKDILDDMARYRSDNEINNRPCDILHSGSFKAARWRDVHVGDVVRLRKNQLIPADMLLLSSSEPHSLCYVETADIDGETNLKYRQALSVTHEELHTEDKLAAFDGRVLCEEPNSQLHFFSGVLHWRGGQHPIDNDRILLRGFRLRNTHTCYGLVLFAGLDSKILRNCGRTVVKRTRIELLMNHVVLMILLFLLVTSLLLAVGAGLWESRFSGSLEAIVALSEGFSPAYWGFVTFWGYIIILSPAMPMALYITFEVIHLVHSRFINWDLQMHFPEKDTYASARSTSLNEQLGQIEVIFSDKTGTLTQNIMTYKKCCVAGTVYGNLPATSKKLKPVDLCWNRYADGKLQLHDELLMERLRSQEDQDLREFFRALSVCHTVMVEEKDGDLLYQAASPDEEALVTAARNLGFVFLSRTQDSVTVNELGVERHYHVLAMLDFSSQRRRMSVLVREPEGGLKLYCKGADIVIFERLAPDSPHRDATEKALDGFAEETLRTLCLACRSVEEGFYREWIDEHHHANMATQGRQQELEAAYERIENNLTLLGATAIEDRLQEGVPETIRTLKRAGIKIWVLTGDKKETAVNIGYSVKLLSSDMTILEGKDLRTLLEPMQEEKSSDSNNIPRLSKETVWTNQELRDLHKLGAQRKALVITGPDLEFILRASDSAGGAHGQQVELQKRFVELASSCPAVICCRVTPLQKARMVELVRRYQGVVTLAIGDGANDVNMIKTAHIGVGISGQEGLQAVQCSDYSIAQFRFLQRLLLVHGRWSYIRICKYLRFFLFKTLSFTFVHIWYSFFNGFTAQDVSDRASLQCPELYRVGQYQELFGYRVFSVTMLHALLTSLILFFIPFGAFLPSALDYQTFAVTVATAAVFTTTAEIALQIWTWTLPNALAILLSIVFYFTLTFMLHSFILHQTWPKDFLFPGASLSTLRDPYMWLIVLLTVTVCLLPSLTARALDTVLRPPDLHRVHSSEGQRMSVSTVELRSGFQRDQPQRRSSYAFSQERGFGERIASGTSLRKGKGSRRAGRQGLGEQQ
ncbi:phospholipid-transporting ATPase IC isoform X2 [Polyodon spathula]|uniref:phospholipid-transporting ATPase IC isoform X2 n=1 Tax=Polyodon spathula TaxID=7913 RepID=UPI001B7EEF33|nr:phospholipid-transporting ATPase IC isoform X2 [Polyodon spathula]